MRKIKKFLGKCFRFSKRQLKKIVMAFYSVKDIILFESVPDLSDNTKAVFDEMVRRGLNKNYKMYWKVSADRNFEQYENVIYVNAQKPEGKKIWEKLEWQAKCLVSCNGYIVSRKKKQFSIYLAHGLPIKSVKEYYTIPETVSAYVSMSEAMMDIIANEFHYPKEKIVPLGYPRNDILTKQKIDVKAVLETDCDKVIVWYPTFRQHEGGRKFTNSSSLPIIHDSEKAVLLNEFAKQQNVLLVVKPHFAQDLSYIHDLGLSNIRFIDDTFFGKNKITSYGFVGSCDALITDYSSIYYDYTLCDKPIALIWEDLEEYKLSPGLIDDYAFWTKGAEKIYSLEELEKFIYNVAMGIDVLKKDRNEIKVLANYSLDGKSSERVVDFILKKTGFSS